MVRRGRHGILTPSHAVTLVWAPADEGFSSDGLMGYRAASTPSAYRFLYLFTSLSSRSLTKGEKHPQWRHWHRVISLVGDPHCALIALPFLSQVSYPPSTHWTTVAWRTSRKGGPPLASRRNGVCSRPPVGSSSWRTPGPWSGKENITSGCSSCISPPSPSSSSSSLSMRDRS